MTFIPLTYRIYPSTSSSERLAKRSIPEFSASLVFQRWALKGRTGLSSAINLNLAEQEVTAYAVIARFRQRNHFVLLFIGRGVV